MRSAEADQPNHDIIKSPKSLWSNSKRFLPRLGNRGGLPAISLSTKPRKSSRTRDVSLALHGGEKMALHGASGESRHPSVEHGPRASLGFCNPHSFFHYQYRIRDLSISSLSPRWAPDQYFSNVVTSVLQFFKQVNNEQIRRLLGWEALLPHSGTTRSKGFFICSSSDAKAKRANCRIAFRLRA